MMTRISSLLVRLVAVAFLTGMTQEARSITIDWVTVGDPGNANDSTGYGAVAESFQIMKYEFTNSQYVEFLNAIDPDGSNPNGVYNSSMGGDDRGGISFFSGNPSGNKYAVRANMGDKPVNYVDWFDVARVANWLQNGAQTYGSTDSSAGAPQNTGAYTIGTTTAGIAPARNSGAQFYIPTEDQWYKAAYYKGSGTNAGYWTYATQSDTAPTAVTAGPTGIGSAGSTGNFANYNDAANWNSKNGNVTTVGTNGGTGAYGTFDQSGNLTEWNDLAGSIGPRGVRGGSWTNLGGFSLSSSNRAQINELSGGSNQVGFRLAAVPEPTTYAMALAGLGCGGFSMWRRRKRA